MRRFVRCVFIGLLAVALTASGSVVGAVSHAAAHSNTHAQHAAHDAASDDAHAHHHHAQHHDRARDETPSQDHASNTCCSMCTVASPLPPVVMSAVQLATSPAEYAARPAFGIAVKIAIDPGIPKRMG